MTAYEVYGALGSPYSMKVRAAFRYKRLAHTWTGVTAADRGKVFGSVKVPVIPIVKFPDGHWANDSTPLLIGLEQEGRALLPEAPAARFACLLLEDMADEWFMKAMFHFRWAYGEDAELCANWLMYDTLPNAGKAGLEEAAAGIRKRQIERMPLVGCTPETGPLIEASWRRQCLALEEMAVGPTRFLFGDRPSLADFAYYGQLKVMATDPTPMAWMRAETRYLYRWIDQCDDASGLEGAWTQETSPTISALLAVAGDTYLPFLAANAAAHGAGEKQFSLEIEGGAYGQDVFPYQVKCLRALQDAWRALGEPERAGLSDSIGAGASILD
ncbi:MAG: glutathione S-transferase N-terminal domain-containing protein [Pseudomonadota bacterium]